MSATGVAPRRGGLIAVLWTLAIAIGTIAPGGGLIVSLVAVCTTYRTASQATRISLVLVGVLTVLAQLSTLLVFNHSNGVGHAVRVQ